MVRQRIVLKNQYLILVSMFILDSPSSYERVLNQIQLYFGIDDTEHLGLSFVFHDFTKRGFIIFDGTNYLLSAKGKELAKKWYNEGENN